MNKKTKIVVLTENDPNYMQVIQEAGKILREGGLVAFPTETVYGIGANALDEEAIKKIYLAKGRPSDNPLIMHISDLNTLDKYVNDINEKSKQLIAQFWPGPLTLIFHKKNSVPDIITGGLETVAVRMPKHPIAYDIIRSAGVPIAAPSANISGKPSPTRGRHVIEDLDGRVDMIIDGGKATHGLESTVLDMTGTIPSILRPGSVTRSMIESVIGEVSYDNHLEDVTQVPKSPGMKYKHYAPKAPIKIVVGRDDRVTDYINSQSTINQSQGLKVGIISPIHRVDFMQGDVVLSIGSIDRPEEIASNLFKILRKFDEVNVDIIYSVDFQGEELNIAIMNRLIKAAGHEIITV
jgi:L-threonylcarbamoyladenylate synthase